MTHEGSPTSHGHNSLTVRSYVTFHIPLENDMYYPYRIVLPTNISKLIPLSIKQTWVHYPNLGSPTSHGHNSLTVRSYVMFHIPPEMA
jgi:hypothetical protein